MVIDKQDVHDFLAGSRLLRLWKQMNRTRSRVRVYGLATKMPALIDPLVWEQRLHRGIQVRPVNERLRHEFEFVRHQRSSRLTLTARLTDLRRDGTSVASCRSS